MKITIYRHLLIVAAALSSVLMIGCVVPPLNRPFTAYADQGRINLKVGLNINDELRKAKNEKWNIPVGDAIATNAPALARQVFAAVVVLNNGQIPPDDAVAAILTPKLIYSTRTVGATAGGESIVDFKLEWTLNDLFGNTIWLHTIDGRCSDKTRTNVKKVSRKALEDLLTKSEQAMASAPAIRQFAQTKVVSMK